MHIGHGDLEARILSAHEACDGEALALLYAQAAEVKMRDGDTAAAGFLCTQAYVFALESGHPSSVHLHKLLVQDGREI